MAEAVTLEKSATSETSNTQGKGCVLGKFISEEDGWKIVAAAKTWVGTPYKSWGGNSKKGIGGDCSGTTNKSYIEAGFSYPYQTTSNFANFARATNRFRQIDPDKVPMQAGDVLLWPGHMAIYVPFPEGHPDRNTGVIRKGKPVANDMYTAFNERRDVPYGPYNIATFRPDKYKVYRYLVVPGAAECP